MSWFLVLLRYYLQYLLYLLHLSLYLLCRSLFYLARPKLSRSSRSKSQQSSIDPAHPTFQPGDILNGTYRIEEPIGRGGFGQAYRAINLTQFNKPYVVKEFKPLHQGNAWHLKKAWTMFKQEAETLHSLRHPQIPKFQAYFEMILSGNQKHWILVQEWIEGQTLKEWIEGNQFKEDDATSLLLCLLPVLTYLHDKNIYHRDIAPDNIILHPTQGLPYLIDFGGVKEITRSALQTNAQSETALLKAGYSPPEQYQGQCYPSSDLYALAATTVAMVTRNLNPAIFRDPNTYVWDWKPHTQTLVSPGFAAVIDRMLQPLPRDRFSTARQVQDALNQLSQTPNYPPQSPRRSAPAPTPPHHQPTPQSPRMATPAAPPPHRHPTRPTVPVGARQPPETKQTQTPAAQTQASPPQPTVAAPGVSSPSRTAQPQSTWSSRLSQLGSNPPAAPFVPANNLFTFTGLQPPVSTPSPPLYSGSGPTTGPSSTVPASSTRPPRLSPFMTWIVWLLVILTVLIVPLVIAFWAVTNLIGG